MKQPEVISDRVSFFGTSQGGGTSLLLGSIFKDNGIRCVAADEPYLTDFPAAVGDGAYTIPGEMLEKAVDKTDLWHAMGLIDTVSHVHRLNIPVLLTAGGIDTSCPEKTVKRLFELLPSTKAFIHLDGVGHGYTPQFVQLATAWFRLHA